MGRLPWENAVAAVPTDHKNYGLHQHNLGDKLSDLYMRTGLKDHHNLTNCASKIAKLSTLRSDAEEALRLAQGVVDTSLPEEWQYPV